MPKILLADDHLLVRDTIAAYLASSGGFDVETAQDLPEAIEKLERSSGMDLAIFDYEMPGMDGLEGLALVRARFPNLVATIISGVANASVAEEGRRVLEGPGHGLVGRVPGPVAEQQVELDGAVFDPEPVEAAAGRGEGRLVELGEEGREAGGA